MLAIVEINGKQYQIEDGRFVIIDRLAEEPETALEFARVLMVIDGENSVIGSPFIEGATVKARVLGHERGPKLLVYKMRCKKGYRLKNGHRQDYSRVQIEGITVPGAKAKKA
jgi:large subunit ribosomal protein L21